MMVATLIGIVMAVVVGVSLIPTITSTVDQAQQAATTTDPVTGAVTSTMPASAVGLLDILPIVFVAVILLGAIAWMGGLGSKDGGGERREEVAKIFKNAKGFVLRIEKSSKQWESYLNNLDELLGIKTVKNDCDDRHMLGLMLERVSGENLLRIDDKSYDWYIADKASDQDMFKVVGLHKKDTSKNLVYLLGKNEKGPYLVKLPNEYLESKVEWNSKLVTEPIGEAIGVLAGRTK